MGWFKRKKDPISEKAQDLTQQIRQLEEQILDLASKKESSPSLTETPPPSPRNAGSLAVPRESSGGTAVPSVPPRPPRRDPVFEPLRHERLQDLTAPPAHYNELGVRKYDLPAAWKRLMDQLRSPTSRNPKLVDLLAAGSLQGIRPLRYEKRIARRRFLLVCAILFLLLWGLFAVLIH